MLNVLGLQRWELMPNTNRDLDLNIGISASTRLWRIIIGSGVSSILAMGVWSYSNVNDRINDMNNQIIQQRKENKECIRILTDVKLSLDDIGISAKEPIKTKISALTKKIQESLDKSHLADRQLPKE